MDSSDVDPPLNLNPLYSFFKEGPRLSIQGAHLNFLGVKHLLDPTLQSL